MILIKSAAQDREFEKLKPKLEQAKKEAAAHKVAAEYVATKLSSLKVDSRKHEARVAEIQKELEKASSKCEALEQKSREQMTELSKLSTELKSERVDQRFFEEEVRQAKLMENGKPYLLQCGFGRNRYAFLTRIWRPSGAFADLPRSVAEATKHYSAHDGDVERRLFWAQFQTPKPNPNVNYQMK